MRRRAASAAAAIANWEAADSNCDSEWLGWLAALVWHWEVMGAREGMGMGLLLALLGVVRTSRRNQRPICLWPAQLPINPCVRNCVCVCVCVFTLHINNSF